MTPEVMERPQRRAAQRPYAVRPTTIAACRTAVDPARCPPRHSRRFQPPPLHCQRMRMSVAVTTILCAAAVSTAAVAARPATRNRAEIPAAFRWDFSAIYPGWDAWEAAMKDMDAKMDA